MCSVVNWAQPTWTPTFMRGPGPTNRGTGPLLFSALGRQEDAVRTEAGRGPGSVPARGAQGPETRS